MLAPGSSREQLRDYLRGLSSDQQAALLGNVERSILRGESVADGELILTELRQIIRSSRVATDRAGSPSRRFFDPVEPFIVDGMPSNVMRGQIARGSLNPIWIWISHTLLPKEAKLYSDTVTRALGADDRRAVAAHVEAFHALAVPAIRKALASHESRNRVQDSLATYMGPARATADLREVVTVLVIRHALSAVAAKVPERIGRLSGEELAVVRQALDEAIADCGDGFIYTFVLVMKRLSEPWQLAKLCPATGQTATSPYRFTLMLVIADIEKKVSDLRTALASGDTETIAGLVGAIGTALAELGSEVDLSGRLWAIQKLKVIRNDVHALLAAEVGAMPTSIRQLFDLSAPAEAAGGDPEAAAIAATERAVALLQVFRAFEEPLLLGNKIASALSEIRGAIEGAVVELLRGLYAGFDGVRKFCLVQISHAVRICTRLFGKKFASKIVTATETAVDDKRHAA
jgi:hypothetical protein